MRVKNADEKKKKEEKKKKKERQLLRTCDVHIWCPVFYPVRHKLQQYKSGKKSKENWTAPQKSRVLNDAVKTLPVIDNKMHSSSGNKIVEQNKQQDARTFPTPPPVKMPMEFKPAATK